MVNRHLGDKRAWRLGKARGTAGRSQNHDQMRRNNAGAGLAGRNT